MKISQIFNLKLSQNLIAKYNKSNFSQIYINFTNNFLGIKFGFESL